MTTLAELAADARSTSEADWSSDRQVDAENRFFEAFEAAMGETPLFDDWCLKATEDERFDEALRLVKERFGTVDVDVPAPVGP